MAAKVLTMCLMIVAAALWMPTQAAAVITLDSSGATVFQQTTNNPCVIGDPSCKQPPLFDYNSQSGPANPYDFTSPLYLASVLGVTGGVIDTIPTTFTIGIDVNFAGGQGFETLTSWTTFNCGPTGLVCVEDAANSFGAGSNLTQHNGNGFSDALLSGFSLIAGNFYKFEVKWSNDTDGMEEFFIIPGTSTPVPEPSSLVLAASGLVVGLGTWTRRRWLSRS